MKYLQYIIVVCLSLQGLKLELYAEDRVGLLSDITRIFRENSLCIRRAEIATKRGKAKDVFYVTDMTGTTIDAKIVESIRKQIGDAMLQVKHNLCLSETPQRRRQQDSSWGTSSKQGLSRISN